MGKQIVARLVPKRARSISPIPRSCRVFSHDLLAIFDKLNRKYFQDRLRAEICWMRQHRAGEWAKKDIMLGTCHVETQHIRINPALNHKWVPRWFVESVVYHEMLHLVIPIPVVRGLKNYHTPEFQRALQKFPLHRLADWWERNNKDRLCSC